MLWNNFLVVYFGVNPTANDPALAAVNGHAEIIRPQILNETYRDEK
jgi:uncharacterized membrane protein